MDFFIRQYSDEPTLKLKLIDDGKNDKSNFIDIISSSVITLDMIDFETKEPVLFDGTCFVTNSLTKFNHKPYDYFIVYKFNKDDTRIKGMFEGIINIKYTDSILETERTLKLPIQEKLYIHVV